MFELFLSWLPVGLSVITGLFVIVTLKQNPTHWKISIIVLFVLGLIVCILAALRDGYGFKSDSVIAFSGIEAIIFSILGASIFVLTVYGLISQSLDAQKVVFKLIALIFTIKLIAMESLRFLS